MTDKADTSLLATDNPYVSTVIAAAQTGDVEASNICLYLIGQDLMNHRPPNPELAQLVGERLTRASISAAASIRQSSKTTTKEKATDIARNLGLIAQRRGPRTSRFKAFREWFYLASLVVHFHEKKGHPLTRNDDGAFFRAAKRVGCTPSKAENAYRKLLQNEDSLVAAREGSALAYEKALARLRRSQNG